MASFSLNSITQGLNGVSSTLNGSNPVTQAQINSNAGFQAANMPTASANGLPYSQIAPGANGQIVRNIITWFVPQFGTVQMFINPYHITYNHKKLINADKTKGGYTLQYWGEELSTLNISGTSGSSGAEGINMLYEIYRAEQYAFDAVAINMAANNAASDVSNNISNGLGGAISQAVGGTNLSSGLSGGGILSGIIGLNSPNNSLSARNIPSLASLAFGVEMYYQGAVYRGFFSSMVVTERAENFLFDYDILFTVTQKRGYRTNNFPWNNSPTSGSSQYNTPGSFSGTVVSNTNQPNPTITQSSNGVIPALINSLL